MRPNLLAICASMLVASLAALPGCATVPREENQVDFMNRARSTTEWFETSVTGLSAQIEGSAGYVVFPDVSRWGILITGGTFGRGAVCRPDGTQIGWGAINTGSVGLQAGVTGFRLLMVLRDEATMERFKTNRLTGTAAGVAVAGTAGGSAATNFQNGVAMYQGADRGLMAGVNIGLNLVRFQPLEPQESPSDTR